MFGSILCPIDFSGDSRAALRYALAVARRSHGSVTALHVLDPFLVNAAAAAYGERVTLVRRTRGELRRFVATARGAGARPVACRLTQGDPAREIASACTAVRADLIVIGTHGLGGVGKLFFGSTTARVLGHTRIPVLAVPAHRGRRARSGPRVGWPGHQVVVPVRLGRGSSRDAARAAEIAAFFGASILLVHAIPKPQVPPFMGATQFLERERAALAKARTALERVAARLPDDARREVLVAAGDAADVVANVASRSRSGLVVLTLQRRRGLFGSAPGTISYRVLRRGTTPVLAVPAHGRR